MECRINDIRINYEIYGEGKPVLMLHGYFLDHRVMLGCMEPVFKNSSRYKRIYIDLPGMGKSDSSDWIINSDKMLEIVLDFIEKVIPNEHFLIAGQSYGGYLTRGIVRKKMEYVDGVLLICPVVFADFSKRTLPEHEIIVKDEETLKLLPPDKAEEFNSSVVVQSRAILERFVQDIIPGISLANEEFLNNLQEKGYEFSFNPDQLPHKFEKPSLILMGKQDSIVGYKDAWSIIDNYSRCSLVVLDKSGHNLQIEQADMFNTLVKEWLERVNEEG